MKILVLWWVLALAAPTHVYEITYDVAQTEAEVRSSLAHHDLLLVKRVGMAGKQKKWEVVIQSRSAKTTVRNQLLKTAHIHRVQIME